jgi:hypothetical protein
MEEVWWGETAFRHGNVGVDPGEFGGERSRGMTLCFSQSPLTHKFGESTKPAESVNLDHATLVLGVVIKLRQVYGMPRSHHEADHK